jgi:branched-chain amino acid transport system substrate-binding protein
MKLAYCLLISICLIVSGCVPTQKKVEHSTIRIGAVLPFNDATGKDGWRSMQLAVKEINMAGGLLGRQIELIVLDDGMNIYKAEAALEELAEVYDVDIFAGGMASYATLKMIPVMKKYEKVTVWCGAALSKVEQETGDEKWFFHIHIWDYQLMDIYEKIWSALPQKYPQVKRKKVFVAYEDGLYGKSYIKMLPEAIGYEMKSADFKSTALGGGDYNTVLRDAKEYEPDEFLWVGYDKDAIPMLEQTKAIGFAPPIYIGMLPSWPVDFAGSPLSEGVIFYSPWNDVIKKTSKASKAYSEAYYKEYRDTPTTYYGPLGYTNIMIIAQAIKRAGTLEKIALIKALEATNYDSPLGDKFIFGKSRVISHQAYAVPKLMQWQKGKVVVLWPWELATGKILYPFPSWNKR